MHIMHYIRNLHNQKLQHYVLGKNPASVQNTITLAQKKDAKLKIIEELHNHDSGHEINNIYPGHNNKSNNIRPCHTCMVLIFLKTVMKQFALDVNLILIIIHHLNASGNATPTNNLATIL